MANFNKVFLIGNLTKDPELRYTPGGTAVVNLRLAINRRFKDKEGQQKDEVCYVNVVAWNKQAEVCNQYLQKGRPVFVEGRLQSRSWEAQDGTKRNVLEVRAERIQFLGSSQKAADTQGAPEPVEEPEENSKKTAEVKTDYGLDSSWNINEDAS
jgi:single-strand DNA-binding protein